MSIKSLCGPRDAVTSNSPDSDVYWDTQVYESLRLNMPFNLPNSFQIPIQLPPSPDFLHYRN